MSKTKLTKNELKKHKDALRRYQRYLPMLQLKKQQLQIELRSIAHEFHRCRHEYDKYYEIVMGWVQLFGGKPEVTEWVKVSNICLTAGNIAGVDIPVFRDVEFTSVRYSFFETPLWVDDAVSAIQTLLHLLSQLSVLERQSALISEELDRTAQRVNLFEKVKIPEANVHIRRLRIYLGDQQTAAVVRGKISKKKRASRRTPAAHCRRRDEGRGLLQKSKI